MLVRSLVDAARRDGRERPVDPAFGEGRLRSGASGSAGEEHGDGERIAEGRRPPMRRRPGGVGRRSRHAGRRPGPRPGRGLWHRCQRAQARGGFKSPLAHHSMGWCPQSGGQGITLRFGADGSGADEYACKRPRPAWTSVRSGPRLSVLAAGGGMSCGSWRTRSRCRRPRARGPRRLRRSERHRIDSGRHVGAQRRRGGPVRWPVDARRRIVAARCTAPTWVGRWRGGQPVGRPSSRCGVADSPARRGHSNT